MEYVINLSDAENKALGVVALDQNEWIQGVVKNQCRIAIEEIVATEVQRKLALGESISGTKEDIVMAAEIETAAAKNVRLHAEFEAEMAAVRATQQAQE